MPFLGVSGSQWVGLKHFERFFMDPQFPVLLKNTLILAVYNIVFFFPLPIILSLMLNEVSKSFYKRFVQRSSISRISCRGLSRSASCISF
jgi:putative aldouronate transport system permease protein